MTHEDLIVLKRCWREMLFVGTVIIILAITLAGTMVGATCIAIFTPFGDIRSYIISSIITITILPAIHYFYVARPQTGIPELDHSNFARMQDVTKEEREKLRLESSSRENVHNSRSVFEK